MRRSTIFIPATTLAIAGGLAGGILWLTRPTYDDHVNDCVAALKDRPTGDKTKPSACRDVTDDDYADLLMSHMVEREDRPDENGDPDRGKVLKDETP
ncbi:hypothetical protein [Streptomyces sp. NPDC059063]|uniref:hypothetical protein n=1 Tax=unclassified Streptomyces TaxID=2593676 RepID=UPI0036AE756A